jgi:hypothetical protein
VILASTTLHRGGAEMRTTELVRALKEDAPQVTVVAVGSPAANHALEPEFRDAGAGWRTRLCGRSGVGGTSSA